MLYIDMKRLRAMNQPTFTKTNSLRTQTYFPSSQTIFVTEATTGNTSALAQNARRLVESNLLPIACRQIRIILITFVAWKYKKN